MIVAHVLLSQFLPSSGLWGARCNCYELREGLNEILRQRQANGQRSTRKSLFANGGSQNRNGDPLQHTHSLADYWPAARCGYRVVAKLPSIGHHGMLLSAPSRPMTYVSGCQSTQVYSEVLTDEAVAHASARILAVETSQSGEPLHTTRHCWPDHFPKLQPVMCAWTYCDSTTGSSFAQTCPLAPL